MIIYLQKGTSSCISQTHEHINSRCVPKE